eukprot:GCRY01003886.1.p1 GENE.GCRY01003886.1~~GCRY01003886.1.p1  ORF type:complete len:192 (-),score=34.67 GCRY01003886.1:355-930(-)
MKISIIVAAYMHSRGIGKDGKIPWSIPEDFKHFAKTTRKCVDKNKRNAIIMGRKTFNSLPNGPLSHRLNVVLSHSPFCREAHQIPAEVTVSSSLSQALSLLSTPPLAAEIENVFICGGESVYREALALPQLSHIYLTEVQCMAGTEADCDAHFPAIPEREFRLVAHSPWHSAVEWSYRFLEYSRESESTTH